MSNAKTVITVATALLLISGGCAQTSGPTAGTTAGYTIPAPFQGRWSPEPQYCGSGWDVEGVHVTRDMVYFYESRGQVRHVRYTDPDEISFTAALYGENDYWDALFTLRLMSPNRMRINNQPKELYRCKQVTNKQASKASEIHDVTGPGE